MTFKPLPLGCAMIFRYRDRWRWIVPLALCAFLFALGPIGSLSAEEPPAQGGTPDVTAEKGRIPFPMPDTHKGDWIRFHGSFVDLNRNEAGQQGTACYVCHDRNDCVECHSTRPPRDHTNIWRMRGHGLEAAGNRERCLRCHRQDYCVRCHNETAPRTHKGNWRQRHCTWCHFGSGIAPADNCIVCHRIAPHTSAPHNVGPGIDCSRCHP
jgi:hypothetical protein